MFLFLIVAVSLACGSGEPRQVPLSACLLGSVAVLLAWNLIAQSVTHQALHQVRRGVDPRLAERALQCHLDTLRWFSIVAVLVCLLGFDLAGAVQGWPVFAQSMLLQAVVLLTPAGLLVACTLWAERRYDVAVGNTAGGCLPMMQHVACSLSRLAGWLIAPILVMLAAADLLAWLPWTDRMPAGVGLAVLSLLLVPLLVPWMAKRLWPTRPLDSVEHRWIGELVAAAGLAQLDVRQWDTAMRSSNAVVIGFFPGLRSLLLTDRLLRDLPPEQLKLIVLHEVAHIRRKHIWLRMLAVLPGWLLAGGALHFYGTGPVMLLLSHAAAIAVTLGLLRLVAHETEFDADRVACELAVQLAGSTASPRGEANAPPAIARMLAGALRRINCSAGGSPRASWLHPSLDARCDRLQRWAAGRAALSPVLQPSCGEHPIFDCVHPVDTL